MSNPNKRSSLHQLSAASKKRKVDVPKFYAVRAGKIPGVYLTWLECQQQTTGFRGAVFKTFESKSDAEAFAAGKKVENKSGLPEPEKYYAVARGEPPGIYTEWEEASEAIRCKGPKFKKFMTKPEAVAFMRMHASQAVLERLDLIGKLEDGEDSLDEDLCPEGVSTSPELPPGFIEIFTDGAARSNGKSHARAGCGVFFGAKDARNIAARLPGKPQTNQRAELMAIKLALDKVALSQNVQITTDSRYSIQCVTEWPAGWERKQWKTANGQPVRNADIIKPIVAQIANRKEEGGRTLFKWVKGHQGVPGNTAADALAVKGAAMDEVD